LLLNLSKHLRRVAGVSVGYEQTALERLIASGRVSRPTRRDLPEPLQLEGDPYALSRALSELRGTR